MLRNLATDKIQLVYIFLIRPAVRSIYESFIYIFVCRFALVPTIYQFTNWYQSTQDKHWEANSREEDKELVNIEVVTVHYDLDNSLEK